MLPMVRKKIDQKMVSVVLIKYLKKKKRREREKKELNVPLVR